LLAQPTAPTPVRVSEVERAAALLPPVVEFVTSIVTAAVDVTDPVTASVPVIVELLIVAPSRYGSSYATPTGFVFVAMIVSFKNRGRNPR
jgi:hypothetical protein